MGICFDNLNFNIEITNAYLNLITRGRQYPHLKYPNILPPPKVSIHNSLSKKGNFFFQNDYHRKKSDLFFFYSLDLLFSIFIFEPKQ